MDPEIINFVNLANSVTISYLKLKQIWQKSRGNFKLFAFVISKNILVFGKINRNFLLR